MLPRDHERNERALLPETRLQSSQRGRNTQARAARVGHAARTSQPGLNKALHPCGGNIPLVGARVVERGWVGLAPCVLPECEALAAQQRWQDGLVPMVARVLFPVLTCGGTRSHPHHRATIKALLTSTQPLSPLRIIQPPVSLPGLA